MAELRKRGGSLSDSGGGWTDVDPRAPSPTAEEFVHVAGSSSSEDGAAATTRTAKQRDPPPPRPPPPSNPAGRRDNGSGADENGEAAEVGDGEVQKTGWAFLDNVLTAVAALPQEQTPEHETPFETKLFIANAERFVDALSPFADGIDAVEAVMHWEDPKVTGTLFFLYICFVLYSWVIPGVLLVALGFLGWAYAVRHGLVEVEVAETAEEEESADGGGSKKSTKGFSRFFGGLSEKYTRAKTQGQKVQNKFALFSQRLEKIILLFDWSTPANTLTVVYVLAGACLLTAVTPLWILGPVVKVWAGFSFFIKAYIYHRYPALKAKYDSTYNFWCKLPDKKSVDYNAPPAASSSSSAAATGGTSRMSPASKPKKSSKGKGKGKASDESPYASTANVASNPLFPAGEVAAAPAPPSPAAFIRAPSAEGAESATGNNADAAAAMGDEIGSWSCVFLNDKITASKAGRLVLTRSHVYFKTRDDGIGLFSAPVGRLSAVLPGDVLKAKEQDSKSSWLSSTLAKGMGKLGDKLGIGSLVLKVTTDDDAVGQSHTFTTMPKRDEAGIAIGNAAPDGVVYVAAKQ